MTATAVTPLRPELLVHTPSTKLLDVALNQLTPHPANRKRFDPEQMRELVESLRTSGQITPCIVRPKGTGYELLAGERRLRAARDAGLPSLLCLVREVDDAGAVEIVAIENNQRQDPDPLEEAELYKALLSFKGYDVARVAHKLGRSVTYVRDRLRLLQLVPKGRQLLLDHTITVKHAILLAALSKDDQSRAIGDLEDGGVRSGLLDPDHEADLFTVGQPTSKAPPLKAKSVAEFKAWIDDHVRFDPTAAELPHLFPETAEELAQAAAQDRKVVSITYDQYVQPEAREGGRILGPRSWKRADGQEKSKKCAHAILGVVAAGERRGQAFDVCIAKEKCDAHWGAERRERERLAKQGAVGGSRKGQDGWQKVGERRQREAAAADAERDRWQKAAPALLKALATKLKGMPAGADTVPAKLALAAQRGLKSARTYLGQPRTAEDLIRGIAFGVVAETITWRWKAPDRAPAELKKFGIDARKIVDEVAPRPKAAEPDKPAKKLAGDARRARKAKAR